MDNLTREQKLEKAFIQLVSVVVKMRKNQKIYADFFGSPAKQAKKRTEKIVDDLLINMGINDDFSFDEATVEFIKEKI